MHICKLQCAIELRDNKLLCARSCFCKRLILVVIICPYKIWHAEHASTPETHFTNRGYLTHRGWVTHICVGNLTHIGSDNGLEPDWHQVIIWTNAGMLLIGPLRTNFTKISIEILTYSFKKMRLNESSAKWRPFCLGLNVLRLEHEWVFMSIDGWVMTDWSNSPIIDITLLSEHGVMSHSYKIISIRQYLM